MNCNECPFAEFILLKYITSNIKEYKVVIMCKHESECIYLLPPSGLVN